MFEFAWRALVGPRQTGKQQRRQSARPRLELLEDRCLPSTAPTISHLSNNNWTEGLSTFSGTMTISGGTAPYTLQSDANLPSGVSPVVSGDTISFTGAPSVAKVFSDCTVTIKDASGDVASKAFVIDVEPALVLGNLTQNQWTVNEAGFNGVMAIGGGTGAYSYVSASGLPAGLKAEVSGGAVEFTGTPTAVGTYSSATVTISDADGASVTQTFTMTINALPTLSPLNTLAWTAGMPGYTGSVTITGGTGPYSISSYAYLPFSAVISGNTVYFTGTAPPRTYTGATFTVRDQTGATVTQTNTITVNEEIGLPGMSNSVWTVGQGGFNGTETINYGTAPFIITGFTALPTGLTPVVNGTSLGFTGIPTVAGSFANGNIELTDSGGETFTIPVNITINPPLAFTTTALPAASDGVAYSANLSVKGGSGDNTFTRTGGKLPGGLTLQPNGHIGGTTAATGVFTFTASVTDGAGAHASDTFTIAVNPSFTLGNLTQTQWTVGHSGFNATIAIKGGVGTFTLINDSSLPNGLSATLTGRTITITGTPSETGTFSAGNITVDGSDGYSASETISITINAAPTIGTLAAVPWTAGQSGYPATIAITGGTGPYTITASSGLPFSPVVSGNTILLVGSGGAGTYSHGVITLRDAAGASVTADVATIVINPIPTVSHMSTNNWTQGTPNFPGAMTISGGTGPFTITSYRNIPLGLTPIINGDLIEFTGTPEVANTFENCMVVIRDATGAVYTKVFVFDIAPPLTITTVHLPVWRSGVSYSTTLQASGGTGIRTFTLTAGSLPPGLTLHSAGKISGTATGVGPYTFTVTVTDAIGDTYSETYTL